MDGLENRRRFAIARGLAKRGLVAFLAFAMAFGTTPTQMWADGVEGIAEAATEATEPSTSNASAAEASGSAESATSGEKNDGAESSVTAKSSIKNNEASATTTEKKSADASSGVSAQAQKKSVSLTVIGEDKAGKSEKWLNETKYELDADATFGDLLGKVNDSGSLGIQYLGSWANVSRGESELETSKGAAWVAYVNGKKSDVIFDNLKLNSGDSIVWKYEVASEATVTVTGVRDTSAETPIAQTWVSGSEESFEADSGATAWDLVKSALGKAGLSYDAQQMSWGLFLNSITSPSGVVMGTTADYSWSWGFYVNGEMASVGVDSYKVQPGDKIEIVYLHNFERSSDPVYEKASVTVTGVKDASANVPVSESWISGSEESFEADSGATAWDLVKSALGKAGLSYDAQQTSWGLFLNSITSPSGVVMGTTADYSWSWGFYVNGEMASVGVDSYKVQPGDKIEIVYLHNFERPSSVKDEVVVDPSIKAPDWDSDWSGFTSGDKVTDAPTPTQDAEAKWVSKLKESTDYSSGVSDPLLVGDYLYVAVGNRLYKKNVDTGETVEGGEAMLASPIDSTSRMVYADGFIFVPLSNGRLQALAVDSLVTKWVTDALPKGVQGAQQSLSAVTVHDGFAYFGTSDADWSKTYGGYLLCVRLSDGKVVWNKANNNSAGYYWSGMAFAGAYGFIADDSGTVNVVNPSTGDTVHSLKVADRVRSSVLVDGTTAYVVSYDGYLHKLAIAADGSLREIGKVQFGFSSTSTPVLANGKIIVGGTSLGSFKGGYQGKYEYHYGQIAVIDADTLAIKNSVCKADGNYIREYAYDGGGDVKSQPIVSTQNGETYIYFTSNCDPGCLYRYKVGDNEAEILYSPDPADQNYCMASVSVGSDGSLYYTNDSGKLFAIKGNGRRLPRYTVSFDSNGKKAEMPIKQKVKEGYLIQKPSDPELDGYTFGGWFTDAACTKAYDFSKAVTEAFTLYAKWTKVASKPAVKPGNKQPAAKTKPKGKVTPANKPIGKVAPSSKPVAKKNTSAASGDKGDASKKTASSKAASSGKKASSSAKSAASKSKAKPAAATVAQNASLNPLAVVGIVAGVIGLVLIVLFVTKKRGEEE